MRNRVNAAICSNFAQSRNLQQTIVLLSHGRGRWFEPSIAHFKKCNFPGKTQGSRSSLGFSIVPLCSNAKFSPAE